MYQNYATYVHTSRPTAHMFWFKKLYIFEFPEEDSIIQPGTAVEGTYSNQSSEGNYQGNSVKNSSEYEEYISDYVGDDDISDSSLLSFSDWSLP